MVKFIKLTSILFTLLSFFLIFPPINKVQAAILFQDDFNSTTEDILNRWETSRNTCNTGNSWIIGNGKVGININNTGACQTEFTPKDTVWGDWNNYVFETDMTFISGTDKNIAFRYSGTPNYDWYDYHFQVFSSYSNVILERVYNSTIYPNITTYPMTNGNTYHLKIIVDNNHLILYVDNNLVLDYPDAGGRFNNGKIALRAGVGADTHTEVYFDNVVVSSIDELQNPIVILPGLTGSWCKSALITGGDCSGDWTALPEPLDPYDSLIASISNASDINSGGVFTWYYDWRKNISNLSNQLSDYIDNTVLSGKPAGTKVRLVGHSYGGLIAGRYAENYPDKVEKIITSGSPHQGAVNAYLTWEGGELSDYPFWQKALIKILFAAQGNLFKTNKDVIQTEVPSIKSLLPTFDYLKDGSDQTIPESSLTQRNPELPDYFTSLDQIKQFLVTIKGLENVSEGTLGSIKIKSPNWVEKSLGLWEDGKPDQYNKSSAGDLTVLKTSAEYVDASSTPEVTATHLGLVTETAGISAILNSLGSAAGAQIVDSLPDENNGNLIFLLRSPATMTVKYDGNEYSDADGFLMIKNVGSGIADVTLTGTGSGIYHLDIIQLHLDGDHINTYSGMISPGEQTNYQFSLNPENPPDQQLIDATGETYLDLAAGNLLETKTILDSSTGRARSLQILISSINQAQKLINSAKSQINQPAKSLSNTQSALLLIHNFRQAVNTYENSSQLPESDATKIRPLSQSAIGNLQSAFIILSTRANRNYSSAQTQALNNLVNKMLTQVDQKGNVSTKGLTPAALARQNAVSDQQKANYIYKYSARFYLEEANKILK